MLLRTVKTLRQVLGSHIGATETVQLLKTHLVVPGRISTQLRFDIGLQNGRLYAASQVLSLEMEDTAELDKQVNLALQSIGDLKDRHDHIDLSLIAAPPRQAHHRFSFAQGRYEEASMTCKRIGVRLVNESDTVHWADDLAMRLEAYQLH